VSNYSICELLVHEAYRDILMGHFRVAKTFCMSTFIGKMKKDIYRIYNRCIAC
jgi:hypothetical protein